MEYAVFRPLERTFWVNNFLTCCCVNLTFTFCFEKSLTPDIIPAAVVHNSCAGQPSYDQTAGQYPDRSR